MDVALVGIALVLVIAGTAVAARLAARARRGAADPKG